MKNSTSVDKEGEGRVILSGANTQNFASDMGFTTAEQAAVLPTSRKGATNGAATGNSKWTYKNSGAYSDELVNDTYFLPSAADLRSYLVGNGLSTKATFANGDSAQYWLGSLLRYDRVGMVDSGGGEWYQHPTMKHLGIRPAFNLNPESVLMYRSTSEANAYAMTLLDSSRNFTVSNIQRVGDVLNVSYTGAQVGANEYISYVLKDKVSGEIIKYGKLANVTAESGDMSFDISNIDTLGYDMYIFNEQVNGEFESNYASEMTKVEYALDDYAFELTVSSNAIKATEELEVVVSIDRAYYSAEFTFTYDTDKFTCAQDTDGDGEIYVTNLYKGEAGNLRTYILVAKNDITSVSKGNIIAVDGNVIQFKEQVLNDLKNIVTGDEESIKISLNYTAEIIEDYVSGYSLVLVRGDDGGYSYNGRKMFYVEGYNAYAILIEGEVTEAQVDEALAKTSNCKVIVNTYNVNGEYVTDGVVDLKDATVVYACSNKHFNIDEYMDLYLLADVNKDGHVYMDDVNAITACDLYVK